MAEGVGFEPTVALRLLLISSQVPLTTQPPFRPFILKRFLRHLRSGLDFLILQFDAVGMKRKTAPRNRPSERESLWQKTPYANLIRYESTGKYFARIRVGGKLIRQSLKTNVLSVAKHLKKLRWVKFELLRVILTQASCE